MSTDNHWATTHKCVATTSIHQVTTANLSHPPLTSASCPLPAIKMKTSSHSPWLPSILLPANIRVQDENRFPPAHLPNRMNTSVLSALPPWSHTGIYSCPPLLSVLLPTIAGLHCLPVSGQSSHMPGESCPSPSNNSFASHGTPFYSVPLFSDLTPYLTDSHEITFRNLHQIKMKFMDIPLATITSKGLAKPKHSSRKCLC